MLEHDVLHRPMGMATGAYHLPPPSAGQGIEFQPCLGVCGNEKVSWLFNHAPRGWINACFVLDVYSHTQVRREASETMLIFSRWFHQNVNWNIRLRNTIKSDINLKEINHCHCIIPNYRLFILFLVIVLSRCNFQDAVIARLHLLVKVPVYG